MPRVLVLSLEADPHVPAVTRHLDRHGVPWALVDAGRLSESTITFDPRTASLRAGDVDLDAFDVVWYRRPRPPQIPGLTGAMLEWAQEEYQLAFFGALHARPRYWLPPPQAQRIARYKPLQLHLAADEYGIRIPETLVTSNRDAAVAFITRHGAENCIAKVLGAPAIEHEGKVTLMSTKLLAGVPLESLDKLPLAPCILQTLVRKKCDVRVTVVGRTVFAARIRSQELEDARIDWRVSKHPEQIPHEAMELPPHLEEFCRQLVDRLGLHFGAIDFVVDEDDSWVFLEINPNGQWLWLETLTGAPIGEAVAAHLASAGASERF